MKHKFRLMGRVAIALVLALSLTLVMGVPVSANPGAALTVDITEPTEDIAVGADFTVTAEVENTGDVKATDVEATIAITGNASTGDALTKTVVAELPVGDTAEVSWALTCNAVGEVSITVTPAGKDFVTGADILAGDLHDDTVAIDQIIPPAYFTVTGTATMTAGGTKALTVTAYYADDSVAASYTGSKTLVFSGPAVAPDGTAPTVEDVTMENEVTVTFTEGVATGELLTLIAYKAETTTVDVSDGTIDSTGDAAYDLDLTVDPAAAAGLVYTVNPASVTAGVETTVFTVQRQDTYANVVTSGATVVGLASDTSGADEEFRATAGGAAVVEVTIVDAASTVDFYYYDELAGARTITASSGSFNTVSTLTVDPAAIDSYTVTGIVSPQVTNTAFPVTIQAYDEFENKITSGGDAAEDVSLTYNKTDAGATPSSFTTAKGTATVDVTLTATTLGQSITFTGGTSGETVTSSPFRVIAAATVWVDVTNGLAANPGTEASPFKTIAAGITAAGVGGTVNVLPGTYVLDSTLTIAADGLTLQATGTTLLTIIDSSAATAIYIDADDVTVDGFTILDVTTCGIYLLNADDAIIRDNVITNITPANTGIDVSWYATGVTISGNKLNEFATMTVHGSDCMISGNNNFARDLLLWPQGSQTLSGVTITGNTFTAPPIETVNGCINFMADTGSSCTFNDILIEGNTLSDRDEYGIRIGSYNPTCQTVTNLTITGNTITNNALAGIRIYSGVTWGAGNTISNNNIYGNVVPEGIVNQASTVINAENNWWGDEAGPYHDDTNLAGRGDSVSNNVDYRPWLTSAYGVEEVTTIDLEVGWNFISVPKSMADATDTFGELLDGITVTVAYSYDPVSGWSAAKVDADPVEVLEGYWVDVTTAGTVTLSYKEAAQEVPASKSLKGDAWNAIGFSSTTARDADIALMSIYGSWSTILGWDAEGQTYEDSIIVGTTGNMLPGKGYWIWMTEDDVLSAISG